MAGGIVQLINSALSVPLATSLFGVQEMTRILTRGLRCCPNTNTTEARIYCVTDSIEDQFGDILDATFDAGDDIQRRLVDLVFDTTSGEVLKPAWLQQTLKSVLHQSYESLQAMAQPRLAWMELQNKYQVYNLVKNVQNLPIPAGEKFPLLALIADAYNAAVYTRLWGVEGLGNRYGLNGLAHPPVIGLLTEGIALQAPKKSLLMLHAGLGLAFATVALDDVNPYGCPDEVRRKIDRFVELCRLNAIAGDVGAAYESMGLVTRTFYPQAVDVVDRNLRQYYPDMVEYFWHGLGRALYFYPTFFVPGGPSPWEAAASEAPDELAYSNAIAGLAWAFTLVNVRQPEIMASFLSSPEWVLPPRKPFADGVMSSMIMARNVEPDETYIEALCQYKPSSSPPHLATNWETLIRPCCTDLHRFSQTLRRHGRLGEVFRYQDLSELVARLESGR
jgi:hypothetical protein